MIKFYVFTKYRESTEIIKKNNVECSLEVFILRTQNQKEIGKMLIDLKTRGLCKA